MQEILHLLSTTSPTSKLYSKARLPYACITGYATTQRSRPRAYNGPFWERIWWSSLLVKWRSPVRFQEESIEKGPGLILGYLFMVFQTSLSALEQSWLHDTSQICSRSRENGTSLKDIFPWPSRCCPFPWTQSQRATVKTYNQQAHSHQQSHCSNNNLCSRSQKYIIKTFLALKAT